MALYDFPSLNQMNGSSLGFGLGSPQTPGLMLDTNAGSSLALPQGQQAAPGFEFGMNGPTFQLGLQGLNTLGNLWGALQSTKLAREQLDFTRNVTNTNLNNSIQSYNTALGDRARARGFTEGRSDADVQSYIDNNRLSR